MPDWKGMNLEDKLGLQNMHVEISSRHNFIVKGDVFVVDPVTESLVIETKQGLSVIIGSFIETVVVLNNKKEVCTGFDLVQVMNEKDEKTSLSQTDISKKKLRLFNWFKNNGIDVTLKNNNIYVFKVAYIEPPYTTDTCFCKNLKMLYNVKKLVNKFST